MDKYKVIFNGVYPYKWFVYNMETGRSVASDYNKDIAQTICDGLNARERHFPDHIHHMRDNEGMVSS